MIEVYFNQKLVLLIVNLNNQKLYGKMSFEFYISKDRHQKLFFKIHNQKLCVK